MKKVSVTSILTIALSLLMCFSTAFAQNVNISSGTKEVTVVSVPMDENYMAYGATAQDTLGKKTGTLEEFSNAMATDEATGSVVFAPNFFQAYDDTKEVLGGVYSQGELLNDSWFDYGCGFDANNKFYLFNLGSLASNKADYKMMIKDKDGNDVEIVTAFNCFPFLIKDGSSVGIEPKPGADEKYLSSKATRAFMGQKADGTFLYGTVNGVSIYELQEICKELGLVNAVNTDGGASAGVYQNGKYVVKPGRELASVVYIEEQGSSSPNTNSNTSTGMTAIPTAATVLVDGQNVAFDAYNIGGYNYFKLRDIAYALNGTSKQFEVGFDSVNNAIALTSNKAYTPTGGEMAMGAEGNKSATPTTSVIYLDGKEVALTAYNIGGNNYFQLRDIGQAFNFAVGYDNASKTITIDTKSPAVPVTPVPLATDLQ